MLPSELPLRLGYYLERVGVSCASWQDMPYRGIDRLPYIPTMDEERRLRQNGRVRLIEIWDEYWSAYDSHELNANLQLVRSLQQEFSNEGIDFEIIYGEITALPSELERYRRGREWSVRLTETLDSLRSTHNRLHERPIGIGLMGYDISFPIHSFHSVIFQPGLARSEPQLVESLNSYGLVDEIEIAMQLLKSANNMDYGPIPFCILGIWQVS